MHVFAKHPTRDELNKLVDKAADLIRTAVDYKFILVLLFLKRINDLLKAEIDKYKERVMKEAGFSEKEAEEEAYAQLDKGIYPFSIPKKYLWDEITKDPKNLPNNLASAINEIAKLNKDLQGVINRVDFLEFARNQENRVLLNQLVELFNKYEFDRSESFQDIVGDAYEHILMKFVPEKAKEGEIYTPREVVKLLIEILDPKPGDSVYDPCCGSGGMLIQSYIHVRNRFGEDKVKRLFLYGQERNDAIQAICKLNLLIHGMSGYIKSGNTLLYPKFREDKRLQRFSIVVANPPWNQDGYGEEALKKADLKDRYSFGYPPDNSADWAWIQHMLASTTDDGKVGVVIDNGCLFREGAEKAIRSRIVNDDLLESVILLPEKLFYNTGAPGAIMIFNKGKQADRNGRVLFINASNEYIPHPDVKRLNSLSDANIKRVVDTYKKFEDVEGFARVVDLNKIRENDYNLTVTLYVIPIEDDEPIDLKEVYNDLLKLEEERKEIDDKISEIISEIIKVDSHE